MRRITRRRNLIGPCNDAVYFRIFWDRRSLPFGSFKSVGILNANSHARMIAPVESLSASTPIFFLSC
jgi:hypothetical protein